MSRNPPTRRAPVAGPAPAVGWRRRDWLAALPALAPVLLAPSSAVAAADPAWAALEWLQGTPVVPGQGVPMLLVFWAPWCAYCRRHNARVERLHAQVRGRLQVVGIAVESEAPAVRSHLRSSGWTFPVALDRGPLRRLYTERRSVPMTCPIDRHGRTGTCIPGEMSEDDVLGLVSLALPAGR